MNLLTVSSLEEQESVFLNLQAHLKEYSAAYWIALKRGDKKQKMTWSPGYKFLFSNMSNEMTSDNSR